MNPGERYRATYERQPIDHLVRKDFYIWPEAIERWKGEGLPDDYQERNLFQYDPPGMTGVGLNLGWVEAPFVPAYEAKVIEDEGDTEIIQDAAGRWLRVFKGRRHGFMPHYIKHPVTSMADWQEDVLPRLDHLNEARYDGLADRCSQAAAKAAAEGLMVRQGMVGAYMYMRALMGPEDLLIAFCDQPQLIHAMMAQWVAFTNTGLERLQAHIELDELAIGEDICYTHGMLISPDMWREFLLPCYQEVVGQARRRQQRRLFFHVDTDGWAVPSIPLYLEAGLDVMSPWEVASGCDVVQVGRDWPDLILSGGIDKRILAHSKEAIEAHLQHIIPAMVERGGYIPTCDHGVPLEVSFDNYMYYRQRLCELDH